MIRAAAGQLSGEKDRTLSSVKVNGSNPLRRPNITGWLFQMAGMDLRG